MLGDNLIGSGAKATLYPVTDDSIADLFGHSKANARNIGFARCSPAGGL